MVPLLLLLLLRKPSEQTKCEYACGQRQQHDKMFVCVRVCMVKEKRCKINFPILNLVEHTQTHITIITTTSSHPDCLNLFFFSL